MKMSHNFLDKLSEFKQANVHIKDLNNVNKILNKLFEDGFDKLQVVCDFDKTITKQHDNGISHMSSFQMFRKCPSITEKYATTVDALTKKYIPIEVDPTIPVGDKAKLMLEWWQQSEAALNGLKVSPKEIEEVCLQLAPSIRDGSKDFFQLLCDAKVPVLVFSAGLGDTVVNVLKQYNVLMPNVNVVSNFLKYDNEGTIQGFQNNIIHVYNKNEFAIKGTDFHKLVIDRDNVVVMGDSLGDAKMADGLSHSNVLKIGFLYENSEEALPQYMEAFDIVLIDDQTMNVANAILKCIKSSD